MVDQLELTTVDGKRQCVPLSGNRVILGRSSKAGIHLDEPGVSRRHAEMYRHATGQWTLRDLGSRNGTWVNGFAMDEKVLDPTDQVRIGNFTLRLLVKPPPTTTPPPGQPTVQVVQTASEQISQVFQQGQQVISAQHLSVLLSFGDQLRSVESADERRQMLCLLMVRPELCGKAAVILRLRREESVSPQILCPPQWHTGAQARSLYMSRSLLTAMRKRPRPMVASTMPGQADVDLSFAGAQLAAMACPLANTDSELDVLYVLLEPEHATEHWVALMTLAAEQYRQVEFAWAARRQAQANVVMEHDLERAREIQQRLVPQNPSLPGVDLAIRFQPSHRVGGDYVDVVPVADGKTLLIVADVSGKGLPAALVSSSVHTVVHVAVRAGSDLVQLVNLLNDYLYEHLPDSRFVTGLLIELDPATGKMRVVCAGHPSPLIVAPDGKVRTMSLSTQPPFGTRQTRYTASSHQLKPEHLLTMFTDGITDMQDSAGGLLTEERFKAHLREIVSQHPLDASEIARQLMDVLARHCGDRPASDDYTFLLARREG